MPFKPSKTKQLANQIINDIKNELMMQGHYDTGKLEKSMTPYEGVINNEIIIQAYALGYIKDLEDGVPANKIKVDDAEFEELRGWVKRKIGAFSEAEATQIAASIVKKWKKEGKPLAGAAKFSQTGTSLDAIKTVFAEYEDKYFNQLDTIVFDELDLEFDQTKSTTI